MNILIVTQYFWPEEFRINDLAIDLVKRGNTVTVLTGNPNYPQGKFFKGYGYNYKIENYKGIKIYRVPIIPRGNNSLILILNYLSFVIAGSLFAIFHKIKYDKIFAVNFSPITALYPAIVYKKRHKTQLYIWVQDLWPESVIAASKISSKFIQKVLTKMVENIYSQSDRVLLQSEGFVSSVKEKGVTDGQIGYIPNWAEDLYSDSSNIQIDKYKEVIPSGFKVMFAGNIGEAQDFNSIVKAAELTRNIPEIKWVIVGDGRKRAWLELEIVRLGLEKTIFLVGRYPVEEMPSFFVHADIMLLTLKNEDIFALTIPSKVQSYMAFGKPIIGMLNGIGSDVITNAKCGYVGMAGNPNSLAENVIKAYRLDSKKLFEMGVNGKRYYDANFSKTIVIDKLIGIFLE
ncbi:glycosyltransferase family 4 protein [Flavobacterium cellulosilyticum]|uniref:Glycosyltransferase WbuB n=1 Tax=Flavobacterium cellulosilyticum TaxID=2541731 RepID=A0A4R5CFI7_9FLAO|nr:glycosyltransferase family 4 protein [Flavobacterium cellulosilyticum]TDD98365.1 glycosyltransferase WbuB [Flavobacterium cellulosilyticum]